MNRPEDQLAGKIVGYLDQGVRGIDPATAERLLSARKAALTRYEVGTTPAWGWAWAAQAASRATLARTWSGTQALIAGAALIAALIGVVYWQNYNAQANELAEVDAGLLTDELPINAYLDGGFDSWLKRSLR